MNTRPAGEARLFLRHVALAAVLSSLSWPAQAQRVVDTFESGANPNEWGWTNVQGPATITPDGGNPGAWVDTGVPYFATHPHFISEPPPGSALQAAIASGTLHTASVDLQRLDTTNVSGCLPTHLQASFVSLGLFDLHSSEFQIEAHTTADSSPAFPLGPFPWFTASFDIPSDATDTPPGWELAVPDGMTYTWADLMHNLDGMRFFIGDPDQPAFSSCSHLGADNVVVTYGDALFVDGFDGSAAP
jgi:hypothetical protein